MDDKSEESTQQDDMTGVQLQLTDMITDMEHVEPIRGTYVAQYYGSSNDDY